MIKIYCTSKVLNECYSRSHDHLTLLYALSFTVFTVSAGIIGGTELNIEMTIIIFAVLATLFLHIRLKGGVCSNAVLCPLLTFFHVNAHIYYIYSI